MGIISPARAEELQTAQQLVVRSLNDLTERHGFGKIASDRALRISSCSRRGTILTDSGSPRLMAKSSVSFSAGTTGDFWFLAQLFVSPTSQGDGVGGALLDRAFEHARKSGAKQPGAHHLRVQRRFNRALYQVRIASRDCRSMSCGLTGRRSSHRQRAGKLRAVDIADTPDHRELLARLDRGALGFARDKHHVFLRGESAVRGVLLYRGQDCVGYAYVNTAGHVGPLAVNQRDDVGDAFATALDIAMASGAPQVSAFLPGVNKASLDIAAACRMRLAVPTVLMLAAEPFGDWQCYLPTNPGFM